MYPVIAYTFYSYFIPDVVMGAGFFFAYYSVACDPL